MTFSERLLELIKEKKTNKNRMQQELNLNKSSILNWTQRGNIPNGETLALIANYFNVSVDYLLGQSDVRQNKKAARNGSLDSEIIRLFESLPPEEQAKMIEYGELLRLRQSH